MERVEEKLSNGNTIVYKRVESGTCYHWDTPEEVVMILEAARNGGYRLRFFLGDSKTGRDWNEENDVVGYIGRSTGSIKIPLLIHNSRSMGGGAMLDDCLVKIMREGRTLWHHPKYHSLPFTVTSAEPKMRRKGYKFQVILGNETHANFKTHKKAERYTAFMMGQRMSR